MRFTRPSRPGRPSRAGGAIGGSGGGGGGPQADLRGVQASPVNVGATQTITMPAETLTGDLLVLTVYSQTASSAIGTPAGWTEIGTAIQSACRTSWFTKTASGDAQADDTTLAITTTRSAASVIAVADASSAAVTSFGTDDDAGFSSGTQTMTHPGITPTAAGYTLAIFVRGYDDVGGPRSLTDDFVNLLELNSGGGNRLFMLHGGKQTTAVDTTSVTATGVGTSTYAMMGMISCE